LIILEFYIEMAPAQMKQWTVLNKDNDFDGLSYGDAPIPKVGDNDVLVKLHAASLNYRDLVIPKVWLA
jgi:NADPH:quinone reductase-like Zn-dependent oxidoreductase